MEPNSIRRQKFNIHSIKEPVNSWLNNNLITDYVNSVKTIIFDNNLPHGHNYKIGRRNLLTNIGPIERDQKPHYDYNNPQNRNNSTIYTCESLVTSHAQNNILYLWCKLCLIELITSQLNTRKDIAIVVENPFGTLCLNAHRSGVHR